jgi:membrane protease subunit HflK
MRKFLAIFCCVLGLASALALAMGWTMVVPGEVVVVRRLGRLVEPPWGPGLHWRYPLGIDQADRVRADAVRQLTIGLPASADSELEPSSGEVMTGDLNLLRIQATAQYRVARPVDWVLHCEHVEKLLVAAAEASVSRALAARGVDAVLRSDRQAIARDVQDDLQAAANRYGVGVAILGVSLTDARPPMEVEADFAAAQSAESQRDRRINEARSYEETTEMSARSGARAKLESAHAVAERTVLSARAEGERFRAFLAQADQARSLTMRRLYIETLQALLSRVKSKLIMPSGETVDLTVLGASLGASAPALRPVDSGPPQPVESPREKK